MPRPTHPRSAQYLRAPQNQFPISNFRLPADWKEPLAQGRLLFLSCFPAAHRRVTAELAARRNEFVAAIADQVWFAHIAPGGKMQRLASSVAAWD